MFKVLAVAAALLPALVATASADDIRTVPVQYGQGYGTQGYGSQGYGGQMYGGQAYGGQRSFAPDRPYHPDYVLSYWQLRRALRRQGFHLINIVERRRGAYLVLAEGEGPFGRPRLLTVDARSGVIVDIRPFRDWRRHDRDRDEDRYRETGQGGYGQGGYGYGNSGSGTGYRGGSMPY